MDLSTLGLKTTATELVLHHPVTGDPLIDEASGENVSISLVGTDSKDCIAETRELQNNRLRKRMNARNGASRFTAEDLEENSLRLLAACTKSWKHVIVDGVEMPCTRDNVVALYTRFPWIREQVDSFVSDREHFLGN